MRIPASISIGDRAGKSQVGDFRLFIKPFGGAPSPRATGTRESHSDGTPGAKSASHNKAFIMRSDSQKLLYFLFFGIGFVLLFFRVNINVMLCRLRALAV